MANVLVLKTLREIFESWHGNKFCNDGEGLTIAELSKKYGVTEAQIKYAVRFTGPYKKFKEQYVEIAKMVDTLQAKDKRSVGKIEKAYLDQLKADTKTARIDAVMEGNGTTIQDFLLLYIKEFAEKYVNVTGYKSRGITSADLQKGLQNSLEQELIELHAVHVEGAQVVGSVISTVFHNMIEESRRLYPDRPEQELEQGIIDFAIAQLPWILRQPEKRWDGRVDKFIRKERGVDWYTGKKTQIFNQWEFTPEYEAMLDLYPVFED